MLQRRRLYRSDEPVEVYVVEDAYGAGDVIFLKEDFDAYCDEYESEDTPVVWHTDTMTGREFGNLPLCDE